MPEDSSTGRVTCMWQWVSDWRSSSTDAEGFSRQRKCHPRYYRQSVRQQTVVSVLVGSRESGEEVSRSVSGSRLVRSDDYLVCYSLADL